MNYVAVVVAAGLGARLGPDRRKAGLAINGIPLAAWSVRAVAESPGCTRGILVVHRDDQRVAEREWSPAAEPRYGRWEVVVGGASRTDSVAAGIAASASSTEPLILVHDAARPLLSPRDLESVVRAATQDGAAILAERLVDTVKRADSHYLITETLSRDELWRAQTPQVFTREHWSRVESKGLRAQFTDEASQLEAVGIAVRLVEARDENSKLTRSRDLPWIEYCLRK